MYLHWLMFSLSSFGWVSAQGQCNNTASIAAYKELYKTFGSYDTETMSLRPMNEWSTTTSVFAQLFVTSITDVNEKAQSLSIQVTFVVGWLNALMFWDTDKFCGISQSTFPKDRIWIPDIGIKESISTALAIKESPFVKLHYFGLSVSSDVLALTTACMMDLYRFPFDIQSCNLTLQSSMHPIEELTINSLSDVLIWYVDEINTQGLWELLSVDKYSATNIVLGDTYSQLIYQITIKRRPLLDVINFILPVFCFLLLDVASYFIDASGAEKLSFKVTLLLTVSVFLQILNDTLPSTGDKIPLIGVYGIVIFILIGVSILETILVSFLMTRGAETSLAAPVETTAAITCQDDGVRDLQRPPETVRNENEEQSHTLNSLKTPLSWTRVARIIEVTFFVLYIITIIVFLSILGKVWYIE